jgi:adenylate cyclase
MKVPGLVVTGSDSAFFFKGKDVTYPQIGAMLNVEHLLDGAVAVAGDRVRVTARLIDVATGNQVWSHTPEARPMTDVFAIQDEIAADVVEQLKIALAGEVPTLDETDNPKAHSLYLQARHILESDLRESTPDALDMLQQAVELDSHYLPARIQLAVAYRTLGNPGVGQIELAEAQRLMGETIADAESIWPNRVEIKTIRGFMAADTGNFATSARYLEAALAQDPRILMLWDCRRVCFSYWAGSSRPLRSVSGSLRETRSAASVTEI